MSKNIYYLSVVIFLLLIVSFGVSYFFENKINNIEKNVEIVSIFGNEVNLSSIKQPYILHFFSSWCAVCDIDHHILMRYGNKLPIYGVASLDDMVKIKLYLTKNGNPYTDVISDPYGSVGKYLDISVLPETLIINKGKIVAKIRGLIKSQEIEKAVNVIEGT